MFAKFYLGVHLVMSSSYAAAAPGDEVCKALLNYGTYDSTDSYSDKDSFRFVHHLLCRSKIESYSQAVDAEAELGVPILDIISLDFGSEVSTSTFKNAAEKFCEKDYSVVSGSSELTIRIRQASAVLANAFVDCITKTRGFFGVVTQSKDKTAFTISLLNKVDGDNRFLVERIGYQPTEIACDGNAQSASPDNPFPVTGSAIITCQNLKPEKSFQLAVNTNIDDLGPIELAGLDETISDLTARVETLEGKAVPQGTIAWFNQEICPLGWKSAVELVGRYAVGVSEGGKLGQEVGQPLGDSENRPTGFHTHRTIQQAFIGGDGGPGSFGNGPRRHELDTAGPLVGQGESVKAGTNAPYVQLLACRKL